jgi:RNA polymerase sigma-70 factor (sigma-E family)
MGWLGNRGDESEFEQFVACSAARLLRLGFLVVGDLGRAEDLVQETLVRVARRWPRVRAMDEPFAYTRRVLVNLARDDRRRAARRPEVLGEAPHDIVSDHTGAFEVHDELIRGLAELTPRQRATLVLRFWEDLPESEVAALLGCSVGTVKTQTFRALEHLRRFYDVNAGLQMGREHVR